MNDKSKDSVQWAAEVGNSAGGNVGYAAPLAKVVEVKSRIDRDTDAIKCQCGGYAERVAINDDENAKYNCGRYRGCCARAFICCVCKSRLVGKAEAPDL